MTHIPYNSIYDITKPLYTVAIKSIPVYLTIMKNMKNIRSMGGMGGMGKYKKGLLDSHIIDIHDSLY